LRIKAEHENWKQIPLNSGLESALFGRMVTSDVLAIREASIYVAHAFTVHEAQVENDYFTVVDDLPQKAGEAGSAGIFDTELASGLYYGYLVVDVPQLVANLEGVSIKDWAHITAEQRALAGRVVQSLLHLVATVSPGPSAAPPHRLNGPSSCWWRLATGSRAAWQAPFRTHCPHAKPGCAKRLCSASPMKSPAWMRLTAHRWHGVIWPSMT